MTLPFLFKGANATVCVSAFLSTGSFPLPSHDFQLGDSFLRNAFQIYNYNGNMDFDVNAPKQPFAQLIPLSQEITDDAQYLAARRAALVGLPPEADLNDPDLVSALTDAASTMLGGQSPGAGSGKPSDGSASSAPKNSKNSSAASVRGSTQWLVASTIFALGVAALSL
ncbi:hypothetical protein EXIGLDRAFT_774038 [Exidia glandulosa HHB12029]|nr:hypothetical protein EXIGLDRAFT_774038 [Exidia glandulosa HHB12029]